MSDHEETYDRGDLSGIVYDIQGDLVSVRLMDGRVIPGARLVTTPSGLLKIDATGLPARRPAAPAIEQMIQPSEVEAALKARLGLPAPDAVEGSAEDDEDWKPAPGPEERADIARHVSEQDS